MLNITDFFSRTFNFSFNYYQYSKPNTWSCNKIRANILIYNMQHTTKLESICIKLNIPQDSEWKN